jgi:hypothetical protein
MSTPSPLRHWLRILLMGLALGIVLYAAHLAAGMLA